jgi:hypothetical protein
MSSSVTTLYIVILLSKPPQATNVPEGEYAQAIIHVVGNVRTCSFKISFLLKLASFKSNN